jgi:hypothetical protein
MGIVVRIHAGLGNQMFQYAAGRSLAQHKRTSLYLDSFGFETDTFRKYELDRFNISAERWSRICKNLTMSWGRGRFAPMRRFIQAFHSPLTPIYIKDIEQGFDGTLGETKGSVYLDGYWQSERYFAEIREVLLKEFTFKTAPDEENAKCLSSITSQNAVCVHIRRGDYVTTMHGQAKHGVCGLDYYQAAVARIRKIIDKPAFFVFSDDPAWVNANFPRMNPMTIVSHNVGKTDAEDLRLMMTCRHFITANSSFSWWAAWLGQFPQKTVIAPRRWYAKQDQCDKDLVPESWIRL